jgi:acetolactate synthase-1/2/3 large subunit
VFANRSYEILKGELRNVGAGEAGPRAKDMFAIDRPAISWTALASSLGVESGRAASLEELTAQLRRGFAVQGPYLIEVMM